MTMSFRGYTTLFTATVAGLMALLAGINVLVDPYGLFRLVRIAGFNASETRMNDGRAVKSIQVCRGEYDVLLVGSSRVMQGLDHRSAALVGHNAYNAGVTSLTLKELGPITEYAAACQPMNRIVIGLDFEAFVMDKNVGKDFARSAFAGQGNLRTILGLILSHKALKDSLGTVTDNMAGRVARYRGHGFFDYPKTDKPFRRRIEANMREIIAEFEQAWTHGYDPGDMAAISRAIERLDAGVERVDIFIPPVHAMRMELYWRLGYSADYAAWLRDLADLVESLNRKARRKPDVRLWNFSGFNSITSEPALADGKSKGRWYFEDSHYRPRTGDLILARIMGVAPEGGRAPGDFGRLVTPLNVDAELAKIREGREIYVGSHPRETELLEKLMGKAAPDR